MQEILLDRGTQKYCKRTVYKVHSKVIPTYSADTWTLRETKSKIQAKDLKFLRSTEGKTRKGGIRNEYLQRLLESNI
jgi:hypothetical protein